MAPLFRWTGLIAPLLLAGCALWRPAVVPMRTLLEPARCTAPADTLLVMLPGSYSLPEEFQSEGFVKIARAQHLAADLRLVDAHVRYYQNRSVIDRLAEDVIRPARAQGYRQIWLVGISIGAVGAMLYADAHPDDVDGVVLIAPYLGTQLTADEIKRAGGLARWPSPEVKPDDMTPSCGTGCRRKPVPIRMPGSCRSSSATETTTASATTTRCCARHCPPRGFSRRPAGTTGPHGAPCGSASHACCPFRPTETAQRVDRAVG